MNKDSNNLLPGLLCTKKGCDITTKVCNYCKNCSTELRTIAFEYDLEEIHVGIFCNNCKNKSMLTFKLAYVEINDSNGLRTQDTVLVEDE
jgi:hypothetical protein